MALYGETALGRRTNRLGNIAQAAVSQQQARLEAIQPSPVQASILSLLESYSPGQGGLTEGPAAAAYRTAGYTPAGIAQGVQRSRTEGYLGALGIAEPYFLRMQEYINELLRREGAIDTRSQGGAFLRDFFGGGGGQAAVNYAGYIGGSPSGGGSFGYGPGESAPATAPF